jgi:hypothetical protein
MEPSPAQQAALTRITAEIAATAGPALPGTLTVRAYPCGKPDCRCHADPARLHGPYAEWTRKISGKTVTRKLTPGQLAAYQPLFDNAKRLRALLAELQDLTMEIIDEGNGQEPLPRRTGEATSRKCGQPPLNLWSPPRPRRVSPGQP